MSARRTFTGLWLDRSCFRWRHNLTSIIQWGICAFDLRGMTDQLWIILRRGLEEQRRQAAALQRGDIDRRDGGGHCRGGEDPRGDRAVWRNIFETDLYGEGAGVLRAV